MFKHKKDFNLESPDLAMIFIKDPSKLDRLRSRITNIKQIQFIVDFDFTVTKRPWMSPKIEGGQDSANGSSFTAVEIDPVMNSEQISHLDQIRARYEKIEMDVNDDPDHKRKTMDKWWRESFQTIASSDFTADNVAKGVQNQKFLRMKESFKVLDEYLRNEIKQQDKMIICSAGLGNVIEKKFEQEKISLENKFIVANYIDYDSRKLINDQMITSSSKNSSMIPKCEISKTAKLFIVIGDHENDHRLMKPEDIPDQENQDIFSIGLVNQQDLNDRESLNERIEAYTKNFDAFVINDEDFSVILKFIKGFVLI